METVYVLQSQSFVEQALPVFVGALAAFTLSVVAFLLRSKITKRNARKQLLSNFSRELKYDLTVIEDLKQEINKTIPKILAGNKNIYTKLRYQKFLNNFAQESYRNGVLFEILSEYEIAVFDDLMSHYTNDINKNWLESRLADLDSGTVKKADVVNTFQYAIEDLDNHTRIINDILVKIESSK